jgi:hypothetical protein
MTMNFDTVIVKLPEGGERRMSADEFTKISITERVSMVARGYCSFYRNGEPIRATEAFRKS